MKPQKKEKKLNLEREVFNATIQSLKNNKVPFLILRNYDNYPKEIGNDIDILVLSEFSSEVDKALKEVAQSLNVEIWDRCGAINQKGMPRVIFWFDQNNNIQAIHFDFMFNLSVFSIDYEKPEHAIENSIIFKNFPVLDKKTAFLHILIHGMFNKDVIKYRQRYEDKLNKFLNEGVTIPEERITVIFPSFLADKIIEALKNRNFDNIFQHKLVKKIFILIKNRLFWSKAIKYFKRLSKKVLNIFFPPGKFVVLFGPDGVGKSTTAVLTNELLNGVGVRAYHFHLGFRPTVLPKRQKFGLDEPKKDKRYPVRDFLRYCYHFLDYWFAYYIRIRPCLVRGEVFIAERYFYDYLLHPSRKFPAINSKFIYWTFRLFMPKPTACVLLTNDSEEILKRRQELTKEEIEEVLWKGRELGKTARRFIEIKTDQPPAVVAKELAEYIVCNKKHY